MTDRPGITVASSGGRFMLDPQRVLECVALLRVEFAAGPKTIGYLREKTGFTQPYVMRAISIIGAVQESNHYPRVWSIPSAP